MTSHLSQIDPAIARTHELVEKLQRPEQEALWLNPPALLSSTGAPTSRVWQPHYSGYSGLARRGWKALEPTSEQRWGRVVLYASKHKEENWALLDAANDLLRPDGSLLFAVPNDYGSKSYEAGLKERGRLVDYDSARKSRVYRLRQQPATAVPLEQPQRNSAGFWSCPGLFSWNAVDRGSALLAEALEGQALSGPVADLGAGWGYLSSTLDPKLELHLFETDRRGLDCAALNLEGRRAAYHWCDLTDTERWPEGAPTSVGTVVTNPPFHAGKKEETALGQLFARLAHRLLGKGGALWLVGNTHLAYPRLLATLYRSVEVRAQRDGFTVVKAVK